MESEFLYARFRDSFRMSTFNNPNYSDEEKDETFRLSKEKIQEDIIWMNDWMKSHHREMIFTDMNDWGRL